MRRVLLCMALCAVLSPAGAYARPVAHRPALAALAKLRGASPALSGPKTSVHAVHTRSSGLVALSGGAAGGRVNSRLVVLGGQPSRPATMVINGTGMRRKH
jgi:hypothetical protein